jgi:hypothetical protein
MNPQRKTRRIWLTTEAERLALMLKALDNPDAVQIYKNLQAASLNNHLPAFEACN